MGEKFSARANERVWRRVTILARGLFLKSQIPPGRMHHPTCSFLAQFGRAAQPKLFFDVHLIGLDRLHAQMQFMGQPRSAEAASDQRKYL